MSIVSVDNIQPIGSGTTVTVNKSVTLESGNTNITGVCTATTFVGNLTGTASANAVLTGSTNNELVTVTGANAITGESGLTYNGSSILTVSGSGQQQLNIGSTNAGVAAIILDGDSNGDGAGGDYSIIRHNSDGDLDFFARNPSGATNYRFRTGTSEKVRIQSGGGISFNGDIAAANALDDYEEGLWTPLVRNSSGTGTAGASNYGYYTKVGNIVHAHATVHWTALNSGTTSTYALLVGFPFPSKNASNYRCQHILGAQVVGVQAGGSGYNLSVAFDGNQSIAYLLGVNSASTGGSNYTHTPTLNSTGTIYGLSITYLTDS